MSVLTSDLAVIGAGSGGLSVAAGTVQMSASVVLIERGGAMTVRPEPAASKSRASAARGRFAQKPAAPAKTWGPTGGRHGRGRVPREPRQKDSRGCPSDRSPGRPAAGPASFGRIRPETRG